jgi:hypothetical protein
MNTAFLLAARHDAQPVIPVETVCRDYFRHLTVDKFIRKANSGEIALPLVRMEGSQKSAKGVHLNDLAAYLDKRHEAARKELSQIIGAPAVPSAT